MPEIHSAPQPAALNTVTHFILAPLFLVMFGFAVYASVRHLSYTPTWNTWLILLSLGLLLLNTQTRLYALRNQDRIIRLEERLRLAAMLPPAELTRTASLTTPQLVALRNVPDAELARMATRAAVEQLSPKAIRGALSTWRYDTERV